MDVVKTRKQGNSLMVTIPKLFNIPVGTLFRPKLTANGIFFEFVEDDDFFDFDTDILNDLIEEGYAGKKLLSEFKKRKKQINQAMDSMIDDAKSSAIPMKRKELEKTIGL